MDPLSSPTPGGRRATARRRDEDEKLERVGGLARDEPTFLQTETLGHRRWRTPRRSALRSAREEAWQWLRRGRKGEHPGELKNQERSRLQSEA